MNHLRTHHHTVAVRGSVEATRQAGLKGDMALLTGWIYIVCDMSFLRQTRIGPPAYSGLKPEMPLRWEGPSCCSLLFGSGFQHLVQLWSLPCLARLQNSRVNLRGRRGNHSQLTAVPPQLSSGCRDHIRPESWSHRHHLSLDSSIFCGHPITITRDRGQFCR